MQLFVTGSQSFIGRRLVARCQALGIPTVGIDSIASGEPGCSWGHLLSGARLRFHADQRPGQCAHSEHAIGAAGIPFCRLEPEAFSQGSLALPEGIQLHQKLRELGLSSSVFSINSVSPHDWSWVRQSVARTGRLIVFDDSKSAISAGYALAHEAAEASPASQRIVVTREAEIDFGVSPETFQVDYDALLSKILENRPAPA